jgi:hypothetical protein
MRDDTMQTQITLEPAAAESDVSDDALKAQVKRVARAHRSGGWVIERATLLAAGGQDFSAAVAWIDAHGGVPELPVASRTSGGLHSQRAVEDVTPLRFVLPAEALT